MLDLECQPKNGHPRTLDLSQRLDVMSWPEPVERVAAHMREAGAEARLEEFTAGTPTAADAARAVGCEPSQIVKSLVFVCDDRFVLALVPGDRRADPLKVARGVTAGSARVAGAAEVEAATGFVPGAVAPFPLPRVERVLIDRSILEHDVVWIGAGSPNHLAALAPADLARVARATPADLVREV
jgi:prolyl-tRNA editing enzyme YbaK/EbsC (Cys-tRNA(Pro) deacylase)